MNKILLTANREACGQRGPLPAAELYRMAKAAFSDRKSYKQTAARQPKSCLAAAFYCQ